MEKDLILAIDNGTQSVRAILFDLHGNVVAKSRVILEPYSSPQPGWFEAHPGSFWNSLCQSCQALWSMPGVDRQRIAGVALTTQRSTIINVDKEGVPLRPAIVWMDLRRTEGLKPIGGLWGLAFKLSGMSRTAAYLQAEAEANWLVANQPDLWKNTNKYMLLSGYLTYQLVGRFVDSVGCQVGYLPFDYKKLHWSSSFDWKWQALPLRKDMLVDLVPPTQTLGEITEAASEATGIPKGLPLVAAAADKSCEVIGAGALDSHIACLSYGTSATINTTHRKYVELIPLIPPYPAAVPGAYSLEFQINRGFWMVSWFKQEFAHLEQIMAKEQGLEPEVFFDELVGKVPAGSQGLVLQPYWSPGLKLPGPEARGAIIGFSDVHTRAHLYRAILEGLAYSLREGGERTSQRSGVPITSLCVVGGGSQSDAAMQLTADVFGLPTSRPHIYDASALGAAIDAAVGLGLHSSFETAVKEMTRTKDTYEPNHRTHAIYDELYRKIYLHMYSHLKPLYEEIYTITHPTV